MTTYEVQCGNINGQAKATSAAEAFRKACERHRGTVIFGLLARYREVAPGQSPWFYQDPDALLQTV